MRGLLALVCLVAGLSAAASGAEFSAGVWRGLDYSDGRGGKAQWHQTIAGSDTSYLFGARKTKVADKYKVGFWEGWTNLDPETGEFLGCGVNASYGRLGILQFSMFQGSGFIITLANPDWRLETKVKYPVELFVDERGLGRFEAHVIETDSVRIPVTYSDRMLDVFRKGNTLAIKAARETSKYRLNGSFAALQRLQDRYFNNLPRKKSQNPFAEAPSGSENPFAEAPSGSGNPFKAAPGAGSPATGSGKRKLPPGLEDVFRVGEWTGTPMTSKKTGAFLGCLIRGPFRAGILLEFLISSDFELMVGLESPQWRLPDTREFPVEIVIDGRSVARALADTRKRTKMRIFMEFSRTLADRFHNGSELEVFSDEGKELARYDLAGSAAALTRLEECFFEKIPGGRVSTDPFSSDTAKSTEPPRDKQRKTAEAPAARQEKPNAIQGDEAAPTLREFVAVLLKNAGLDEFRMIGGEERDDQTEGASNAWTDGKTLGLLLLLENSATDFYAAASDTTDGFKDTCREIIAPEVEEGTFGDGRRVYRWSGTCVSSESSSFIAVLQIESGEYVLGFVHLGRAEGATSADDSLHDYFAGIYR